MTANKNGDTSGKTANKQERTVKNVTIDLEATDVTQTAKPAAGKEDAASAQGSAPKKADEKTDKVTSRDADGKPDTVKSASAATSPTSGVAENGENPAQKTAEETARKDPAKIAPTPELREGGAMRGFALALLGGGAAVAGLLALQSAGLAPSFGPDTTGARIEDIGRRLAAVENLPPPEFPPTASRDELSALGERIGNAERAAENALEAARNPALPEEADDRLDALESGLADARAALQRLADAPASPASDGARPAQAALPEGFARLPERFSALEARLGATEEKAAALAARIETLAARTTEQATADAALKVAQESARSALSSTSSKLEGDLQTLREALSGLARQNESALAELSSLAERTTATETALRDQGAANKAVRDIAKTVALDNFKKTVQSGAPFEDALAALRNTGYSAPELAFLAPYAAKGVPGIGALRSQLQRLIGTAAARADPEAPAQDDTAALSVLDKLARNARALIKVRQTGETGDPLGAMETAFEKGDAAGFEASMRKLRENQQDLFGEWLTGWKAHLAAASLGLASEAEPAPSGDAASPQQ